MSLQTKTSPLTAKKLFLETENPETKLPLWEIKMDQNTPLVCENEKEMEFENENENNKENKNKNKKKNRNEKENEQEKEKEQQSKSFKENKKQLIDQVIIDNKIINLQETELKSKRLKLNTHEYHYDRSRRIAVNNNYLCYAVKDTSNREGSIRIINRNNNRHARITGHKKAVIDLCFSSQEDDLLASVSRDGHLNMYMIMEINNEIRHGLTFSVRYTGPVGIKKNPTKYLQLDEEFKQPKGIYTKVIWHPKHQNVLATISTDQIVVIWDVLNFFNNSGKVQVLESSQIEGGTFSLIGHEKPILDISFTPKGDHFVSASMDGTLKIWKYKNETCVKTIIAHDGEPVDSIIYCANPLKCNIESKIKKLVPFCITGAKNNSEIKLWNTETWECLQQLKFIPPELSNKFNTNSFKFAFQLYLNMSSQFLIIADTLRPFIYVLHLDLPKDDDKNKIESENKNNNKNSGRNQLIKFNYISKFKVEDPIYNMVLDHQEISKNSKELSSTFNGTNFNILLFCIKRKSIERYLLKTELCDPELISNKVNLKTKKIEQLHFGLSGNNKDESIDLQSSKQNIINRLLNNLHGNSSGSKNTTSSNNSVILTNESIKNVKNTKNNENEIENIKENENMQENEVIKMNKNDKKINNKLEKKNNDDDLKIKNDDDLKIDLNINGDGNGNGNDNSIGINNSIKSKNKKETNENKQKEKENDLNKKNVQKEIKPKISNLKNQSNQKRGNKKETNQGSFFQSLTNNNEKENIKYKPQILNNYNFKKDNNKAAEADNFDGNTKIDPKKDIYSKQTIIDSNNKNFIKIRNEEKINKIGNIINFNKIEKEDEDEDEKQEKEVDEEKEENGIKIEANFKKIEKKMIKKEEEKEGQEKEKKAERGKGKKNEINTIQKNNQKKRKKKKNKFSNVWKKKKVKKTNKNKNQITNTNNNDRINIPNKNTKNNENNENDNKMNKKLEIKKINENKQINRSKNQKKYNVKKEIIINKTINNEQNQKQLEQNFNLFTIECSKQLDQTFNKLDKEQEKIQWMESGQNQEINEIIIQFEKGIKKTVEISFEKFIKKAISNSINKKNHNINSANKNDKVNQEVIEKINKIIQELSNHDLYFDKIYKKIFAKASEEFIKILKSPSTKKEVSLGKNEIALMIEQKIMKFAGFSIKNNQNFKIFFKKLKQFNSDQQNSIKNHNDQKNGLLIKNLENYWKLIQNEINNKIQVITKETWSQLEQISNYWKGPQAICKFYISAEMYNESLELILKYEEIEKIETLLLWFFDELKAKGILNLPRLPIKSSVLLKILNILTFNLESNFDHKIDTLLNIILKLNKAQTKFCLQKLNKIMSNLLNLINIYTKQQNVKKIIQLKKTLLLIKSKTNILKKLK
ncbi:enhancer of mRNA-decapping protein [Anaeramoeba flamelloides]|uniref:Enhancer of mRNA-decapping protein n=1 Tax=Anaeramoeba flamelloides TaxID=1746091 RepID=A0AAV7ZVK7_9EUKA|nr:enhancer of mRNA-decapping protein [Anaeramoeba flamelloides]